MARYEDMVLTTSLIPARSWLAVSQPVSSSVINLVKVKVVPNAAGGTSRFQVYKRATFLEVDKLYDTRDFTGSLIDPVEDYSDPMTDTPGATAERNEGSPIPYEDDDAGSRLHLRVYNGDVNAKSYTVTVRYERVVVPGGSGGDLELGNLSLTGSLIVAGLSSLNGGVSTTSLSASSIACTGLEVSSGAGLCNIELRNEVTVFGVYSSGTCLLDHWVFNSTGTDQTPILMFRAGVYENPAGTHRYSIFDRTGNQRFTIKGTTVGISQGDPYETGGLTNVSANQIGSEGFGNAPGGLGWAGGGVGWAGVIENTSGLANACGLLVKNTLTTSGRAFTVDSGGVQRFTVLNDGRVGIGTGVPGGFAVHWALDYYGSGFAIGRTINPTGTLFYMADTYTSHNQPMVQWQTWNTTGAPILQLDYAGSIRWTCALGPSLSQLRALDFDAGGAYGGAEIRVGRNTNASSGAGSVNFVNKNGIEGFVWQDAAGQLRIATGPPTHTSDTVGVVVGTQTSAPGGKQEIKPVTPDERTAIVQRMFNAPLFTYELTSEIEGGIVGLKHLGFMSDQQPMWMRYDENSIDEHRISMEILVALQELATFVNFTPAPPAGPPARVGRFINGKE